MKLKIGEWLFDSDTDTLSSGDRRLKLEPRASQVLAALAADAGEVLHRDTLVDRVWGRSAISDHSVAIVISHLRKAFSDDPRAPRYIETIAKRGYKLIAPVSNGEAPDTSRRAVLAIAAGVFLAGLVGVGSVVRLRSRNSPAPQIWIDEVANLTGDPRRDADAYAINELLIDRLSRAPGGVTRWRAGAGAPLRLPKSARGVGARLVAASGGPALSVQVSDARGRVQWSHIYPLAAAAGTLEERVAADLARALGVPAPRGSPVEAPAEAWELYWQARRLFDSRSEDGPLKAVAILGRLLTAYPDFAPGHAALAAVYAHKTGEHLRLPRIDTFDLARRELAQARRLGGETAETWVTQALVDFYEKRSPATAVASIRKALQINSGYAPAWQTRAMALSAAGQDQAALEAIETARRLDPSSYSVLWDKVWFLYVAGRPRKALEAASSALKLTSPLPTYMALIHQALGDRQAALDEWIARAKLKGLPEAAARALPRDPNPKSYAALLRAQADHQIETSGVPLAVLCLNAGASADAARAIRSAPSARDNWMVLWAERIPALRPLPRSLLRDAAARS